MGLSDIAALGEAIGGFAVLIALVYPAYQFHQTSIIERTAGRRLARSAIRPLPTRSTRSTGLVGTLTQA